MTFSILAVAVMTPTNNTHTKRQQLLLQGLFRIVPSSGNFNHTNSFLDISEEGHVSRVLSFLIEDFHFHGLLFFFVFSV